MKFFYKFVYTTKPLARALSFKACSAHQNATTVMHTVGRRSNQVLFRKGTVDLTNQQAAHYLVTAPPQPIQELDESGEEFFSNCASSRLESYIQDTREILPSSQVTFASQKGTTIAQIFFHNTDQEVDKRPRCNLEFAPYLLLKV